MTLSGTEIQHLRDAVCSAFSKQEVIEIMRFGMDVILSTKIVVEQPLDTVVFELIEWLIKQGEEYVRRFVEKVYLLRKGNAAIVAFCGAKAPYLVGAGSLAQSAGHAGAGIDAAATAASQDGSIKLQLAGAKGDVGKTRKGIATLGDLKKIHDQLHYLELRLLRELRRTARNFRNNPTGDNEEFDLSNAVGDLAAILRTIRREVEALPSSLRPGAEPWVETMETAHNQIVAILNQETADRVRAPAGDPLHHVNHLLLDGLTGFSPILHSMLFQETSRLPLDAVIVAFASIVLGVPAAIHASVSKALDGLRHICALLEDQVGEHGFWQKINIKLHLAEKGLGRMEAGDAAALNDVKLLLVPALADVSAYCAIRPGEAWADQVNGRVESWGAAWADHERDLNALLRAFQTLQKQIGERFKDVDDELLDLCELLNSLDGPLVRLQNHL